MLCVSASVTVTATSLPTTLRRRSVRSRPLPTHAAEAELDARIGADVRDIAGEWSDRGWRSPWPCPAPLDWRITRLTESSGVGEHPCATDPAESRVPVVLELESEGPLRRGTRLRDGLSAPPAGAALVARHGAPRLDRTRPTRHCPSDQLNRAHRAGLSWQYPLDVIVVVRHAERLLLHLLATEATDLAARAETAQLAI
jgi:hypothetical protein